MSDRSPNHARRQRRLLAGLALLFFAPLGLSFYLYYGSGGWRPGGHVNHGELIDPPRPLPSLALPLVESGQTDPDFLRHKWTLLYLGSGSCGAGCRASLYDTRQVRLALNRDMDRVQRVFLASGDCDVRFLHEQHPDLITVRLTPAAESLLRLLPSIGGVSPENAGGVYLIDPLGNLMMSYAANARPKGMLEDIKRLLGLSQVG